jgi:hypothetical protein
MEHGRMFQLAISGHANGSLPSIHAHPSRTIPSKGTHDATKTGRLNCWFLKSYVGGLGLAHGKGCSISANLVRK